MGSPLALHIARVFPVVSIFVYIRVYIIYSTDKSRSFTLPFNYTALSDVKVCQAYCKPMSVSADPFALENIIVRPLTSADVSKVRELHVSLLPDANNSAHETDIWQAAVLPVNYPLSFFLQLLVIPTRICLIAYHRSQPTTPIGFLSAAIQQPLSIYNHTSLKSPPASPLFPSSPRSRPFPGFDPTKPRLEILTLGVLPLYQNHGIARQLIDCAVQTLGGPSKGMETTLIYANVSTTNMPALQFYERMGMYVFSGTIKNLYRTSPYGSRDAYLVVGLW